MKKQWIALKREAYLLLPFRLSIWNSGVMAGTSAAIWKQEGEARRRGGQNERAGIRALHGCAALSSALDGPVFPALFSELCYFGSSGNRAEEELMWAVRVEAALPLSQGSVCWQHARCLHSAVSRRKCSHHSPILSGSAYEDDVMQSLRLLSQCAWTAARVHHRWTHLYSPCAPKAVCNLCLMKCRPRGAPASPSVLTELFGAGVANTSLHREALLSLCSSPPLPTSNPCTFLVCKHPTHFRALCQGCGWTNS